MRTLAEIIDFIKTEKRLQNDADVAVLLGIKPKTLATAKVRNSIPYEELTTFCNKENISLNWLLSKHGPKDVPELYRDKDIFIFEEKPSKIKDAALDVGFVFIPQVRGEISAGGGRVPDETVEMRIAFRRDWIERRGDPRNMSLIRVTGDSMEPTLLSGDLVLVDHSRNFIDPQGGIYAIALDDTIMIKRVQVIYPSKDVKIISDNSRYEPLDADYGQVKINGKVIWFGREIER